MNFKNMIMKKLEGKLHIIMSITVLMVVTIVFSSVVVASNNSNEKKANGENVVSIYTNEKEISFITTSETVSEALDNAGIGYNPDEMAITPALDYGISNDVQIIITKKIQNVEPMELNALDKEEIEQKQEQERITAEKTKKEAEEKVAKEKAAKEKAAKEKAAKAAAAKKAKTVKAASEAKSAVISSDMETITVKGKTYTVKKAINMKATAYSPQCDGGVTTATGKKAQYGYVAVDPRIIPLGTKLYIKTANGSFVYGYAVAEDTGGAIKGNRIDLFMNSKAEANNFGRRNVVVYVLG